MANLSCFVLVMLFVNALAASTQMQKPVNIVQDEPTYEMLDPTLDRYVEMLLKSLHVPGLSVAVVDLRANSSDQIESKGYGISSFPSVSANGDTLYFTGSTTKAFTAAAAGKLVLDNDTNLRWSSRMNEFLPTDFVLSDDYYTSHTTLEDALSHRSGLPRHDLSYGPGKMNSIVKSMRHLPITAEPRTKWQYCNLMFAAVGDLIETITGKSLGAVLQKWFWDPLGMRSTFFLISDAVDATDDGSDRRLARGYHWVDDFNFDQSNSKLHEGAELLGGYYVPEPYLDLSGLAGAGATISCVNDYALWIKALLQASDRRAPKNSSSPISSALYRELLTPRTIINTEAVTSSPYGELFVVPPDYALGWISQRLLGHVIISHSGGLTGFGTELHILPNDGFGVVTMGNTAGTSNIAGSFVALTLLQRHLASSRSEVDVESQHVELSSFFKAISPEQFCIGCSLPQSSVSNIQTNIESKSDKNCRTGPCAGDMSSPKNYSIFSGIYVNPAYGRFNVTTRECSDDSSMIMNCGRGCEQGRRAKRVSEVSTYLHIQPSPKLWTYEITLEPTNPEKAESTFFDAAIWQAHGPFKTDDILGTTPKCEVSKGSANKGNSNGASDAACRDTVAWTRSRDPLLAYFEGGPDGIIEKLGIELDAEMITAVKESSKDGKYDWRRSMIWFDRE